MDNILIPYLFAKIQHIFELAKKTEFFHVHLHTERQNSVKLGVTLQYLAYFHPDNATNCKKKFRQPLYLAGRDLYSPNSNNRALETFIGH